MLVNNWLSVQGEQRLQRSELGRACPGTPRNTVLSPQAIKNNAGFRVWVLFFLVMCSFSLLFLDWYDS